MAFLPTNDAVTLARARSDFVRVMRAMLICGRAEQQPPSLAFIKSGGERLQLATRAAVGGGSLADAEAVGAYRQVSLAWLQSLRSASAFDAILPDMRSAPMFQRFAISTTAIIGDEIDEGRGIGVKQLTLAPDQLRPKKCAAICVITNELARMSDAESLIDAELRAAVAIGTDRVFLNAAIAATTPIASTGTAQDIDAMLGAVPITPQSRLHWVFSPEAIRALATERNNGMLVWPDADVVNGGRLYGIPVSISDQLPADTALLVDAAQIAANQGEVDVSVSGQAAVEMVDESAQDVLAPVGASSIVSLFQANQTGIKAVRTFGFTVLRSAGIASVAGIAWATPPEPDEPVTQQVAAAQAAPAHHARTHREHP